MRDDRPWMTALEKQFAALRNSIYVRDSADGTIPPADSPEYGLWCAAHDSALFLKRSACFAWTTETAHAVLFAAKTIPETTTVSTSTMLPDGLRASWWWFESPLPLCQHASRPEAMRAAEMVDLHHIVALMVGAYDNGDIILLVYRTFSDREVSGPVPTIDICIPANTSLSAIRQDASNARIARSLDVIRFVLAARAWLQQRIMTMSSGHIERHRRKQLAREHGVPLPSDVKVIQLRRTESASRPPSAGGESVDWSCRWIVNGHWRNQPYRDERKLIYIMPFVKGPADMPLRVPSHTMYQVRR